MANIKKITFNTIKYIAFVSLGIFLFYLVTKEYKLSELFNLLFNFNKWYLLAVVIFSILSNISRAMRWNMLLEPMGYRVKLFNAFVSINIMYLANFFIPRGGEVARCGVLAKTDDVPFAKLVGTVIIERIADVVMLVVLFFIVLITQSGVISDFFHNNPGSFDKISKLFSTRNIIIGIILIVTITFFFIVFRKKFRNNIIYKKLAGFYRNIVEGVKTIFGLKKPVYFILHTIFIYLMWFCMLFTFFKGFEPTSEFGMLVVISVFVLSSLAMIVPVPAGMGAYHFTVASTLVLYGITFKEGIAFAFISHTAINLYLDLFGLIGLLYFLYLVFLKSRNNTGAK